MNFIGWTPAAFKDVTNTSTGPNPGTPAYNQQQQRLRAAEKRQTDSVVAYNAPQEQPSNAGTSVNAGRGVTEQKSNQIPTDPRTESTTKNNKMLLLGAGVLVAGSIIYLMTKKSKK
jgi:hypothetical protein